MDQLPMGADARMLDTPDRIAAIDVRDMLGTLLNVPHVLRQAPPVELHGVPAAPRFVFVAGMGGSATVGDIAAAVAQSSGRLPVTVIRDYQLPQWAGPEDFLVAVSYSGETEETLSVVQDAARRDLPGVAVTGGGHLRERAAALGWPTISLPRGRLPREALADMLCPVFTTLATAGALEMPDLATVADTADAVTAQIGVEVPLVSNPAKQLATCLLGSVPVIVAAEHLRAAARRWRDQLTENSKALSYSHELPELNHNGIMGWTHHDEGAKLHLVFLDGCSFHPQNARRYSLSRDWADLHGIPHDTVQVPLAGSRMSELVGSVLWGDYLSVYLALLTGRDPSDNDALRWFKSRLGLGIGPASETLGAKPAPRI